jgi:NADH-quinone oxidoreductase subunit N
MSTAPKVAPFVILIRVLVGPYGHVTAQWQPIIEVVSIASMFLGSFAAIGQTSIKRLLAYSSIGHMGYALVGLAPGTESGVRGVLIYLLTYVAMSAGAFACVLAMRRNGRSMETISDLAGLAKTDLPLATLLTLFMFSMAGIPPLAGFFGKVYVFLAAVQSGLWLLAIIGVLTSVVACFYYIRIIKVMFFDAPAPAFDTRSASVSFVAMAAGVFTLLFLLVLGPFTNAAEAAAKVLFG